MSRIPPSSVWFHMQRLMLSSRDSVLQSLDSNGNISPADNALSAVCSDDKRFLQTDTPNFEACSLDETVQSLVLVHEAINVLYAARTQYDDQFIITQGLEIGLDIDESFIANYEHLLLRLQSQLVETLTRKVIEALLENNLDKTQRKLLNWFTEFPDNRHPQSTTWPWSIKPSLAVLWGYVAAVRESASHDADCRQGMLDVLQLPRQEGNGRARPAD
jgi:hypothetical protein